MITQTQADMLQEILDCKGTIDANQYQGPEKARIELLAKQGLVALSYRVSPKGVEALAVKQRESNLIKQAKETKAQ